jgi:hypothetical protein
MFAYRRRLMRLMAIGISAMLALALAGPGIAIACEGASDDSYEIEDETTKEKRAFSPTVNTKELWGVLVTWNHAVTVKATKLNVIKKTGEWELARECAKGPYAANETCSPAIFIKCLAVNEELEAQIEIEIGAGVFAKPPTLFKGKCLA